VQEYAQEILTISI